MQATTVTEIITAVESDDGPGTPGTGEEETFHKRWVLKEFTATQPGANGQIGTCSLIDLDAVLDWKDYTDEDVNQASGVLEREYEARGKAYAELNLYTHVEDMPFVQLEDTKMPLIGTQHQKPASHVFVRAC